MVRDLVEIGGIDDGDDATKVLRDVDGYVVNGTFVEWRHNSVTLA